MIHEQIDGNLTVLTLDRQERRNAMSEAMLRALIEALDRAEAGGAHAVILTGAGPVFSAGADLDEVREGRLATSPAWEALSARMATMECLTVAALNGTLAGGSFGVVLACDIRLAVPEAEFFYPVIRLGVLPQPSDPGRLAALVGPSRARMLLMGGARITADEARLWGLVDRLVPAEGLMQAARDLCAGARAAPAEQLSAIKALIPAPAQGGRRG